MTIAGERLELARLQQVTTVAQALFLFLWEFCSRGGPVGMVVRCRGSSGRCGVCWSWPPWLGRRDIARRTVTQVGLTRFMAICLLSGYVWLGLSGLAALIYGGVPVGPQYDVILHAFSWGSSLR